MINCVYRLVEPGVFTAKFNILTLNEDSIIIKPTHLAICHADQRYYLGNRNKDVIKAKLPMALIHECTGIVVQDPKNIFKKGDRVIALPNIVGQEDNIVYENYREKSKFLSSGYDGFMQELIALPRENVILSNNCPAELAAITEFVSVAIHSIDRFNKIAHERRETIGVWGDGNLSYVVSYILSLKYPNSKIVIIGKKEEKLSYFSYVHKTYRCYDLPKNLLVDHAFDCTGGLGSEQAIDQIISSLKPQGTMMLLGVSENKVPFCTRDILEKGITTVGCSRSSRKDFEEAVKLMEDKSNQRRLIKLISKVIDVKSIEDIHNAFKEDLNSLFKTVMKWEI